MASDVVEGGGPAGTVLEQINDRLRGIQRRMDRKFARNLTVMALGIFLAAVAVGVAFKASNDLATAKRNTAEARVASCKQYNLQQDVQIVAEVTQSHDLVGALARGIPDPVARQRQVDQYNKTHDAIIESGHPHRNCTAAGIAAYLSEKP